MGELSKVAGVIFLAIAGLSLLWTTAMGFILGFSILGLGIGADFILVVAGMYLLRSGQNSRSRGGEFEWVARGGHPLVYRRLQKELDEKIGNEPLTPLEWVILMRTARMVFGD